MRERKKGKRERGGRKWVMERGKESERDRGEVRSRRRGREGNCWSGEESGK